MVLCSVASTRHGLKPQKWIGWLFECYSKQRLRNGPLFRDEKGSKLKTTHFEPYLLDRLECIKNQRPELMVEVDDVYEEYGILWSFRRGSTSKAVNQGVPPDIIDANNRRRKVMRAKASHPSFHMREHYTDLRMTQIFGCIVEIKNQETAWSPTESDLLKRGCTQDD